MGLSCGGGRAEAGWASVQQSAALGGVGRTGWLASTCISESPREATGWEGPPGLDITLTGSDRPFWL